MKLNKLEDKIVKILASHNAHIDEHTTAIEGTTLDLADAYYKKQLIKSRSKMIDTKLEMLELETEYNCRDKEFYEQLITQTEAEIPALQKK